MWSDTQWSSGTVYWSAVINGVLAAPIMTVMMLLVAIYLACGSSVPTQLSGFVDNMLVVLKAFAAMAGAFCSMRIGKVAWTEFIDDLDGKKAISVSPNDVW